MIAVTSPPRSTVAHAGCTGLARLEALPHAPDGMRKVGWRASRDFLVLLLALGLAGQALAISIHPPAGIPAVPSSEAPEGEEHDPLSCEVCQLLSQVRLQGLPPASPALPAAGPGGFASAPSDLFRSGDDPLLRAAPRAPPRLPLS